LTVWIFWDGLAGSAWLKTMSLMTRVPGLLGSEGALMPLA